MSSSSIKTAKMFSKKLRLNNVKFINESVTNLALDEKIDLIISSQCLKYVEDGNNGLNSIKNCMHEDSNLICIENLNSVNEAKEFISNVEKNGLYVNYFDFPIIYKDLNDDLDTYPVIIISKSNKNYVFDLEDIFQKSVELLAKLEVKDII